jgi:hypothetical protein
MVGVCGSTSLTTLQTILSKAEGLASIPEENWRPEQESNLQPPDSKSVTLSN